MFGKKPKREGGCLKRMMCDWQQSLILSFIPHTFPEPLCAGNRAGVEGTQVNKKPPCRNSSSTWGRATWDPINDGSVADERRK